MFSFNRNLNFVTTFLLFIFFTIIVTRCNSDCNIPTILRGEWFSWEGKDVVTKLDATAMTGRGHCVAIKEQHGNYIILFKQNTCYTCVKFFVRTVNVLERIETSCINVSDEKASLENICNTLGLDHNQQLITLFSEDYTPVSCKSSLQGVWNFTYSSFSTDRFIGTCNRSDSYIESCPKAGSQFLSTSQRFNIFYKKCLGMPGTFDGEVQNSCLGDWFVGKNQFFVVANTRESRRNEKYRCFIKNRDDDLSIGISITAECNTLKSVEKSPEILHLTPVKPEIVEPGCSFSKTLSGNWSANIDVDVFINETHIVETSYSDEERYSTTMYVCKKQQDTRVMVTRLSVDGCQKEYMCYDFLPQHHNVIRYRRGKPVITDNFDTVCAWEQFPNRAKWKYDLYIRKIPAPIRCPVAGKFSFIQKGDIPFEKRLLNDSTVSSNPNCKRNILHFSVCDTDQKEIVIDETYCLPVDDVGLPVDIYSDSDYRINCIAYWKENITSYLITYDEADPFSKYRCWVYQITDINRVLMSQALGPFCDSKQDAYSSNYTEGAAVHIDLQEYKTDSDYCPLHFDDGSKLGLVSEDTRNISLTL